MKKLLSSIAILAALLLPAAASATTLFPTGGGTGSTTLSGILIGNGVSPVNTLRIGSNLTLSAGTLNATGGASSTLLGDTNTWSGFNKFLNAPIFNSLTGLLKGNGSSAITAAANGTDFSLISALTCGAGQFFNSATAAGVFVCGTPAGTTYTGTFPVVVTGSVISTLFSTTTNNGMTAGFLYSGSGGIWQTAASSSFFGYMPLNPTRQLTVSGTANQISISGGTQDLTADRSWVATLPAHVIFPGNFQVGNSTTTNATTTSLSILGSTTLGTVINGGGLTTCTGTNALTYNGTVFGCTAQPQGTVTSVTGTFPIASTGGATPNITFGGLSTSSSIAAGAAILYATGVNTVASAATGTVAAGTGVSVTANQFVIGSGLTITNTGVISNSCSSGITCSGTNPSSFSIASNALTLAMFPTIAANTVIGNLTGGTATPTAFATSSLFTGTTGQSAYFASTGGLQGTSTIFFTTGSLIGIGTTTPDKILHIQGSQAGGIMRVERVIAAAANTKYGTYDVALKDTVGVDGSGPAQTFSYRNIAGTVSTLADIAAFRNGADNTGVFAVSAYTAGTPFEVARFQNDTRGLVGIGTTTPRGQLNISNATSALFPQLVLTDTNAGANLHMLYASTTAGALTFGKINDAYALTELMSLSNAGTLTLNTLTGTQCLHEISGAISGTGLDCLAYPFTPSSDGGINTSATSTPIQGTRPGLAMDVSNTSWYGLGGALLAYGSTTNQSTVFGLGAGGQAATTSNNSNTSITAIGFKAGNGITTGLQNTAIGANAMSNGIVTGNTNTAIGVSSLGALTGGSSNISIGGNLGNTNVGNDNVAIGVSAMTSANTTVSQNIAIGTSALTAINGASTFGNIAMGYKAGGLMTAGSANIIIGFAISPALLTTSAQLDIGNVLYGTNMHNSATPTSVPQALGTIGIGTTSPFAVLSVFVGNSFTSQAASVLFAVGSSTAGTATTTHFLINSAGAVFAPNTTTSGSSQTGYWCYDGSGQFIRDTAVCLVSAARYKQNINPISSKDSLAEVLKLQPVSFFYKPDFNGNFQSNPNYNSEQVGFTADQVMTVDPRLVVVETATTTFEGKVYPPGAVQTVRYDQMAAILAGAIQGLDTKINNIQVGKVTRSVEENWQWTAIILLVMWNIVLTIRRKK